MSASSLRLCVSSECRRRAMGWAGLVILGLVLLTSAFADLSLPSPAATAATADDLPFGQMVICTGAGLRIVDLSGDGDPYPVQTQHAADELCLMCLPLAPEAPLLAAVLVLAMLLAATPVPRRAPAPAASRRPARPLCCGSARVTRGPPPARA